MRATLLLWAFLGNFPSHSVLREQAERDHLPLIVFVGCDVEAGDWIADHEPESVLPHIRVSEWTSSGRLEYIGHAYHISGVHKLLGQTREPERYKAP